MALPAMPRVGLLGGCVAEAIKKWRGLSVPWSQRGTVPLGESSEGRLAGADFAPGEYTKATPPLVAAQRRRLGRGTHLKLPGGLRCKMGLTLSGYGRTMRRISLRMALSVVGSNSGVPVTAKISTVRVMVTANTTRPVCWLPVKIRVPLVPTVPVGMQPERSRVPAWILCGGT